MTLNFIILLVISAFWGLGYLFVKVGEKSVPPVTEMVGRSLIATVALVVLCLLLKKDLLRPVRKYKAFMLFGVLGVAIPWVGIAFSEEYISSGLAAAMASSMPLFTFLITALVTKTERFTIYGIAGLAVALIGLILVIGLDRIFGHSSTLLGVLIILGAFLSYATNGILVPVYAKDVDPFVTTTYAIGFGAVILIILAFILEKPTMTALNTEALLSLIGLGVISTALGFSGFYLLIKRAGPFFTSLLGYLAPVFGIIAGVAFLHEEIDGLQIAGIILVLLGIFLINKPKFDSLRKPG
ncbi:MAG: DMT family transporter [Deltaproteobacteria bacterium]